MSKLQQAVTLALGLGFMALTATSVNAAGDAKGDLFVIDTPKIMTTSAPSALGRKHLEDVQKTLQESVEDVKKAWEKAKPEQRQAALNDALIQLNRQMEIERLAVNQQVINIIREETEKWRKAHKAKMIFSRENLIAADDAIDITSDILDEVNKRKPTLGELPKVTVHQPKFDKDGNVIEEKKAEEKKK